MAMLMCAAEDETKSELKSALGYETMFFEKKVDSTLPTSRVVRIVDMASIYEKQLTALKKPYFYTLSFAHSMLSQKDFEIKYEYKTTLTDCFKALLLEVDFLKDVEEVVKQLNEWVKVKTRDMIPNVVDQLDPSTAIALMNAVYFKGSWSQKFDEASTSVQKFYNKGLENNVKEVNMMYKKEKLPFTENESFQALQLPYAGKEVTMLVLLPRSKDGLESIESSLMSSSFVQDLKKSMKKQYVEVSLPRFRLEYSKYLVPSFQRIGIDRAFKSGAQLGLASDAADVFVSEIIHKAVLEVNEEGREAAAAVVAEVELLLLEDNPVFCADHPFAFIIFDTTSDLIIFMGRVDEL